MSTHETDPLIVTQTHLPLPLLAQAQNGVLNPADRTAVVKVGPYPGMTCGDKLLLTWAGLDTDGLAYKYQVSRFVSEGRVGEEIVFTISDRHIAALDGGSLEIHYALSTARFAEPVHSGVLQLSVGDIRSDLLPATANDAVGGTLDPERVKEGAVITIRPYARMAAGDWVLFTWSGVTPEASFSDVLKVEAFAVGDELSFWVGPEFVTPNLGATVTFGYCVQQEGQAHLYSEQVPLLIGTLERRPLASPVVLEAEEGWLDLQDTLDGVTIVIEDAQVEDGELVYLKCDGDDFFHRDDREITSETAGQAVVFIVPYRFWREHSGSTIRVSYQVERLDDTSQQSDVTLVQVQPQIG
ncbi:hypothetical protein D3C84_371420 [compost metagenome]